MPNIALDSAKLVVMISTASRSAFKTKIGMLKFWHLGFTYKNNSLLLVILLLII